MKNPETGTLDTQTRDSTVDAAPVGGAFLVEPVIRPVFTREQFSEEQKEIELMVRQFADERIRPARDDLAKLNQELTMELMREVGELGLASIDIPEAYGGSDLGSLVGQSGGGSFGFSGAWVSGDPAPTGTSRGGGGLINFGKLLAQSPLPRIHQSRGHNGIEFETDDLVHQ